MIHYFFDFVACAIMIYLYVRYERRVSALKKQIFDSKYGPSQPQADAEFEKRRAKFSQTWNKTRYAIRTKSEWDDVDGLWERFQNRSGGSDDNIMGGGLIGVSLKIHIFEEEGIVSNDFLDVAGRGAAAELERAGYDPKNFHVAGAICIGPYSGDAKSLIREMIDGEGN